MKARQKLRWRPGDVELFHEHQRCRQCNRILSSPKSLKRGLGPACAAKSEEQSAVSNQASGKERHGEADR